MGAVAVPDGGNVVSGRPVMRISAGIVLGCLAGPLAAQDISLTPPPGWQDKAGVPPIAMPNQVPCTISPWQTVELAAPMIGVIERVLVKPGQAIKKGDLIAVFESGTARNDLAMAEFKANSTKGLDIARSRLAGLEKRLDRLMAAQSSRAVPAADLENAQLEVDVAKGEVLRESDAIAFAGLEVQRARHMVNKASVLSPVNGSVGETLIDPGESPGQEPIATIYVTDPLKIEAYLPTNAVTAFLKNSSYMAEIAGKSYPITFDHRANVADLSSNTLSVFFQISAPDVLPGFDCKIIAQGQP